MCAMVYLYAYAVWLIVYSRIGSYDSDFETHET
jgi:hypothetical protein